MMPRLYTYVATALAAGAIAAGGAWKVQELRWTANTSAATAERAEVARLADELRATDARQQRRMSDGAAGQHANTLANLNIKLGNARAHIARLSDRKCFGADTVRMLNAIGAPASGVGLRAPAGHTAGAAAAPAGSAADDAASGYASERNAADHIATCRTRYAVVSDQINQILDIEERRHILHAPFSVGEVQ